LVTAACTVVVVGGRRSGDAFVSVLPIERTTWAARSTTLARSSTRNSSMLVCSA